MCTAGIKLLEKMKLDDVVGAIPAHLIAGIWGTLAVTFTSGGQFHIQLMGIAAVGGFVFGSAFSVWWALDRVLGVRIYEAGRGNSVRMSRSWGWSPIPSSF